MKKLFSLLLASVLVTVALAQDKIVYDAHAEQRPVTAFRAIKVSHGIDLLVKQGNEDVLAVSADKKEYRDAVKTEVVNGELRIYIEQGLEKWWQQLRKKGVQVKAYVSIKNLDRLNGSSGAKTTIDGSLQSDNLSVNLSSGASLFGEISAAKLDIDQSSGASSSIRGKVQQMDVAASSGAHFSGYKLTADHVKAEASSGGKIELSVAKVMTANASSGGGISYRGEGSVSTVNTSSGGKVRKG